MRLRILELPIQPTEDSYRQPWIFIVDEVADPEIWDQFKALAQEFGAEGILLFRERLELEGETP